MSLKTTLEEFKAFAVKGNVVDMAVGVIIGGAFGKIVSSLVSNVVMPPLGMVMGKVDFSNLFISLNGKEYATLKAAQEAGAPVLAYGSFLNTVLDFVILAFVVFVMIRQINKMMPEDLDRAIAEAERKRWRMSFNDLVELIFVSVLLGEKIVDIQFRQTYLKGAC